jgi:intracellular multiplication protein IcmK
MPKQTKLLRSCIGLAAILMVSASTCLYAATGLPIGNNTPLQRALDKQTQEKVQGEKAMKAKTQASSQVNSISDLARDQAYQQVQGEAFKQLLQSTAPMAPDQIRKLHQVMQNSKKVVANPAKMPSRGTSNTIIVDVSPGATAPVIRLSRGYVTAVRFLDATGQSWPISAYDIGNGSLFDVHWDQKGNTLFMEANTDY